MMNIKRLLFVPALMVTSCYYLTVHEQPSCRGIGNGIDEEISIIITRIDKEDASVNIAPGVAAPYRGCEDVEEVRVTSSFGQRTYARAFFDNAERKGKSNFWIETSDGLKLVPDKVRDWKKYADRYSDSTSSAAP